MNKFNFTRVILLALLAVVLMSAFSAVGTDINSMKFGDKTGSTTDTRTYFTTYSSGSFMVCIIACDNIGTTTDGDKGDITSVADDAGNTYTKAIQFTNVQGGAASGATVAVYYCELTTGVTSSNTLTVTYNGSPTATAAALFKVTKGGSTTIGVEGTSTLANDGADPGSMTISSLSNIEHLWFRVTAYESPVVAPTITSTWNNTFSPTAGQATSGGGSASNMGIFCEHKVSTSTSETSDPTLSATDNASVLVAFYEYTPASIPRRIMNTGK